MLGAVAPTALRPGLLDACIAPAAARLHAMALRASGALPEVVAYAAPVT